MRRIGESLLRHCLPDSLAHWDASGFEFVKAMNVDSKIVGCDPLPMKGIDSADFAEEMGGRLGVELVFGERFVASQQPELAFMDLDHKRVLASTNRAVTHGEFRKIRLDYKPHGTAVAGAKVLLESAGGHAGRSLRANV